MKRVFSTAACCSGRNALQLTLPWFWHWIFDYVRNGLRWRSL